MEARTALNLYEGVECYGGTRSVPMRKLLVKRVESKEG